LVPLYSGDAQSGTPTSKSIPVLIFSSGIAKPLPKAAGKRLMVAEKATFDGVSSDPHRVFRGK
jgi:hypothetical protein